MVVDLEKRWLPKALCATKRPELFFTDHGTETLANPSEKVKATWEHAKRICRQCPVREECARDYLGEVEGIWGGLDPSERIKLRKENTANILASEGADRQEYIDTILILRGRKMPWQEVARVIGTNMSTVIALNDEHEKAEAVRRQEDARQPSLDNVVIPIAPTEFPDKAPTDGDGWARYNRRVVWGYYLGQTDDNEWYCMKLRLLSSDYSVCWIKAEDVKLTKPVARTVMTRVGNGSRIYGTTLSGHRGDKEAG